ncbi:MAG: hypothetical protein NUV77_04760 [Thermoguttaceae bacterium]|nr:hypothetical protein [Thermoguttaceae bacterium]
MPIDPRRWLFHALATSTSPISPAWMRPIASRTHAVLRLWVPTWSSLPERRTASTISRPSRRLWQHGFSTYTCLPASRARIDAGACQWSGVAMNTASTARSSSTWRRSLTALGALPDACSTCLAAPARRF